MKYGWKKNWKKKEHQLGLGIQDQFFFLNFVMLIKWRSSIRRFIQIWLSKNMKLNFSLKTRNFGYI